MERDDGMTSGRGRRLVTPSHKVTVVRVVRYPPLLPTTDRGNRRHGDGYGDGDGVDAGYKDEQEDGDGNGWERADGGCVCIVII